jgi:transcriptional regulator MraZ
LGKSPGFILLSFGVGVKLWEKVDQMGHSFFFSGSSRTKLDEKSRFVLPQEMRYGLIENGVLEASLALGLGGCVALYRRQDMEKIVEQFRRKQNLGRYQKFFTLFFSTLYHTSCDKLGRMILPLALKRAVGITKEVTIAGVLNRIEIWPQERYDAQMDTLLSGKSEAKELRTIIEEAFGLLDEQEPTIQSSSTKPNASFLQHVFPGEDNGN